MCNRPSSGWFPCRAASRSSESGPRRGIGNYDPFGSFIRTVEWGQPAIDFDAAVARIMDVKTWGTGGDWSKGMDPDPEDDYDEWEANFMKKAKYSSLSWSHGAIVGGIGDDGKANERDMMGEEEEEEYDEEEEEDGEEDDDDSGNDDDEDDRDDDDEVGETDQDDPWSVPDFFDENGNWAGLSGRPVHDWNKGFETLNLSRARKTKMRQGAKFLD